MLLTSQNRISVFQANSANLGGTVLAAAVAHRPDALKRREGMRRMRHPVSVSPRSMYVDPRERECRPATAGGFRSELTLQPRIWASLVLSKTARG
jgi:hypothetical protein